MTDRIDREPASAFADRLRARFEGAEVDVALPRGEVGRTADVVADHLGDRAQCRVAAVMAMAVIEGLEVVHINHQQRQRLRRALGAIPFQAQALVENATVGQAGERVGGCQF